jgi:serine/threonine protein phosphatase PrpC
VSTESTLTGGRLVVDVSATSASDVGAVRSINQDSFLTTPTVFLVADGMGGHTAGERASAAVKLTFETTFGAGEPPSAAAVLDAITAANLAVRSANTGTDDETSISGTTLAGVAVVESGSGLHWMAFNIGDSRVYQWNGRTLAQLSVDHSAVQEMIERGELTQIEASHHPERNVITRAIGATDIVDPDVWLMPVHGSQSFLICSDGLTKEIDDVAIAAILANHRADATASSLAQALVDAAVAAGGADNVTAVFVQSHVRSSTGTSDDFSDSTRERLRTDAAALEDTRPTVRH